MDFMRLLNQHYNTMLKALKGLGYKSFTPVSGVTEFIRYIGTKYPNSDSITKEMFDDWLSQRVFNTSSNKSYVMTKVRGFLRYLRGVGVDAFVPGRDYSIRIERFIPYIFTDEELTRLFEIFDTLPPEPRTPKRHNIVPVLFRMMYCCGMRPSEPPSLLVDDVNLETGEIYIRKSKYKDRRILMSQDMLDICRAYAKSMTPVEYFFERFPQCKISAYWIERQLKFCWERSGLPKRGKPRPYDFRHNFVARTMTRWVEEGKDINSFAPFLSAYLGHESFKETLYYFHLVPERLLKNSGIDWSRFSSIYPEVHYEQDL